MNVQSTRDSTVSGDEGTRQPQAGRRDPEPDQGQGLLAGGPGSGGDRRRRRFTLTFGDEGCTAIVLGGGPSVRDIPIECFDRFPVIAVNDGWYLYPRAKAIWAADRAWWEYHGQATQSFEARRFCSDPAIARRWGIEDRVVDFDEIGLSLDWERLGCGGKPANSGAQAINLAYHAGARRILLFGFDMQPGKDGKNHWFGEHPKGVRRDSPYKQFVRGMWKLASDLQGQGVHVLNCSPHSALPYWQRLSLAQTIALCAPT